MKGEEDGYEDNGEDYDTFPDEAVVLRLADRQEEPSRRDKERRNWVHSEVFHDDGYEDYNSELPRDSEWGLSDVANGEPAEREDFAEKKFNGAVDTYEESDDWNVAENSEIVGDDAEKDLAEKGESRGKHADILS